MVIPFTKMQAYGNDYVYINAIETQVDDWQDLAIKVSNRNFGVGSDGMILIAPSTVCDFRMRVFDPDGTECEMCGNALRSVSKYVYYYHLTDKTEFTIETYGGNQHVELDVKDGEVISIHADIGEPVFDIDAVPVNADMNTNGGIDVTNQTADTVNDTYVSTEKAEFYSIPVTIEDRTFIMSSLSWGNPHTVMFIDDVDTLDIKKYGPAIENHPLFPKRTNVTFAQVVDENNIKIREWERGTGETIGCGTGCCSAVVFGNRLGYTGRHVDVMQIGGMLHIDWDENNHVHMVGPSTVVYEGQYYYEG